MHLLAQSGFVTVNVPEAARSTAGIRGRSLLSNVVAQIRGVPAQIAYAASQLQFEGLDQVNVYVPRNLAGAGEVPVVLTVDGITANVVTINIK